jgi:hypothetical protein
LVDLLISVAYALALALLTLLGVYLLLRVGTLAVLKSIDEFHRSRKVIDEFHRSRKALEEGE